MPAEQDQIQKAMKEQRFSDALTMLDKYSQQPADPEMIFLKAVCYRYLKQYDHAKTSLNTLRQLAPGHIRAMQEEGHLLRVLGDMKGALRAYSHATQANPALVASWKGQIEILLSTNRNTQALRLRPYLEYLLSLPKPLVTVMDYLAEGKLLKAEELCRNFLQKVPHHVEAMRLLAQIGTKFSVFDEAEFLLESALEFQPNNIMVRMDYVQVLRKRQKFELARQQAKQLLAMQPDNPQIQSLYAIECMQTNDYVEALNYFDKVLLRLPNDPVTLTSKGHALKTKGDTEEAIACYRAALSEKMDHGEAWYSLANLKTVGFTDDDIEAMSHQVTLPQLMAQDRIYLYFAMGKALEDNQDYDQAFEFYRMGNDLKKAQSRYKAEQTTEEFDRQQDVVTPALVKRFHESGCPAPDPIFIVGLPRAGSTLLEQILSSHSQVDGTLELPNVLSLVHSIRRGERFSDDNLYPEALANISPEQYTKFGEDYIRDTKIHRQNAPYFIDKMPNNFRHIGLIKLMLPNAKIIDARRHPLACCFSGYKQLFAEGQEFSYSLEDIGQYYRDYVKLMDYWQQLFPGQILHVQYENVVDDFENQVQRILDYCGLDFEPACLSFHKTERAVRTASSEQVRQPLYRSGLEQWRHFEAHLDPLKETLGQEILMRYAIVKE